MPPSPKAIPKSLTAAALLALLIVGGFFRFYKLDRSGPFVSDECDYYLEAQFLYTGLSSLAKSFELFLKERRTGQDLWKRQEQIEAIRQGTKGKSPWRGRIGHTYPIALAMAFVGPDVRIGNYVSATFGVLVVGMGFLVGRRLYGEAAGLLAAALLSLSGFLTVYSRSALLDVNMSFFLLAALYTYLRSRDENSEHPLFWLSLCSVALGMGFLVVYRTLFPLAVFWAFELSEALSRRQEKPSQWPGRAAALGLPMFFLLLLAELPYYLGFMACQLLSVVPPFMTYFQQVLTSIVFVGGFCLASTRRAFEAANFLSFPYLFGKLSGPLVTAAFLGGVLFCIRRRKRQDLLIAALFLFDLFVYSILQPRARYGCFAACLGAVMAAGFLHALARRVRRTGARVAACLFLVLLVAEGGLHTWKAILPPPGYREAMAYMASHKGLKHISSYPTASQAYGGMENVWPGWPETETELRALYEQGYRYVLLDFLEVIAGRFYALVPEGEKRERLERSLALLAEIRRSGPPVFECPNPPVAYVQNIFEVNHNFSLSLEAARKARQNEGNIQSIDIYDLEAFFEKRPSAGDSSAALVNPTPADPTLEGRGVRPPGP
jgi:hypothetical protein